MQGLREHLEGALFDGRRRQVGAFKVEPEFIRPLFVSVIIDQLSGHLVAHLASQIVGLVALHRDQHMPPAPSAGPVALGPTGKIKIRVMSTWVQKCAHLGVEVHEFGRERAAQLLIRARVLHGG
jgi:hypothetical protein